jgi:SWI/SNF-related matrix-associated actin-dependent regulator 1 of chromatin subfamily A
VNTFINNPACRLFIANIQAGGIGIDGLQQVASDVAFVEFAHTPLLHNQAEDRLCRMGQKDSVTSYYFVAPNTIDMDAIEVLDGRSAMFGGIMDGKAVADIDLLSVILERRGCTTV